MFDFSREDKTGTGGVKLKKVSESNPEESCQSSITLL